MRRRTRARELALQFLYTLDTRGDVAREELEDFLRMSGASAATRAYATGLVDGVRAHQAELDARIAAAAEHWRLERIARLDRNILRLAAYELYHVPDVPPRVAITEGIELGKRYSTARSGAFINGILDRLRAELQAAEPPTPDPGDAAGRTP